MTTKEVEVIEFHRFDLFPLGKAYRIIPNRPDIGLLINTETQFGGEFIMCTEINVQSINTGVDLRCKK